MKTRLIVALAWLAIVVAPSHGQSTQGPSDKECFQVFPRADFCRTAKEVNGTPMWEVWRAARDEDAGELLGYVLARSLTVGEAPKALLVFVTPKMMIAGLKLRDADDLQEEFISQFIGKNLHAPFAVAQTPADLLFIPSKIRMQAGDHGLSAEVVAQIRFLAASLSKSGGVTAK